jgi:predicted DNA repair protein MutK
LVAGIVKLDDLGQHLTASAGPSSARAWFGRAILRAAPWLMKTLSVAGTLAMFLVGGGILTHAVPALHDFVHHQAEALGPLLAWLVPTLVDLIVGLVAGSLVLALWTLVQRVRSKKAAH